MIEIRHPKIDRITDVRQAYDQIYTGTGAMQGILHRDSLYEMMIDALHPAPGSNLIDIACGEGRLVTLACRRGLRAAGIDFSFPGVQIGHNESPAAGWLVGDGERLPLASQSYDYLTNIGSLEHFFSIEQGAQEMGRVLKPGGRACVMVPNAYGLFGNIQHVARTGDVHDDGQPLQRIATRRAWERLLESGGLQVEKALPFTGLMLRNRADLVWLMRRPQKLVRLLLSRLLPVSLANNFIFICKKPA